MIKFILVLFACILASCGSTVPFEKYQKLQADQDQRIRRALDAFEQIQRRLLKQELTFYVRQGGTGGVLYEFMPVADKDILRPLSKLGPATKGPVRSDMIVTVRSSERLNEVNPNLSYCVFEVSLWKIKGREVIHVDRSEESGASPPCNPEEKIERLDYSGTKLQTIIWF